MQVSNRKYVGWIVTLYLLSILTIMHIERMIRDYGGWRVEVSMSVMIQVVHLSTFAWDYSDGAAPVESLSNDQKKYRLEKLPNLFEYLAAGLSPLQCFVGPTCNFVDFRDYMHRQGHYKTLPATFFPAMKLCFTAAVYLAIYIVVPKYLSKSVLWDHEFKKKGFFTRV